MRNTILVTLCLCLSALAVSAQDKTPDFSGDWKLDIENSELGGRARIESMTMKVTQSETELSVERNVKRKGRDASIGGALGGGNRGRGRQRLRRGIPATIYDLTGKETSVKISDGIMNGNTKLKAESSKGKLMLTQDRILNTPRGERKMKSVESWELSDSGNTLTISTVRSTRRGERTTKMVFTKTTVR